MTTVTVVKIGGNVIDDETALSAFLDDFAALDGARVLVHGGGRVATDIGGRLGVAATMVDGRRVTDARTLEVVTMVYGGLVNKRIVAGLQARSCNALGLTGADADAITARRRPPAPVDFGFVGDVDRVNADALLSFLRSGLTPVLAPLTHDGAGTMLNTNADTIASSVAVALARHAPVQLVYCFEKRGVLADAADDDSIIPSLTPDRYDLLKQNGAVSGGMLPKLDTAFAALRSGVQRVYIAHARNLRPALAGEPCATVLTA